MPILPALERQEVEVQGYSCSWAVVAHTFNPSTWEAEAGRFLSSRPASPTEWVPGQPGLHRETLSQKTKKKKKKPNQKKNPLIPALRSQRQADFLVQGQPGLQSEFQDSHRYTGKPCLEKQQQQQNINFGLCCFFGDRVSLYSPGCPGTHFVDQAGLELRNLPASASQVLGLKACATTLGFWSVF